ncbi:ATP synthase F0 subunit B [Streptomyces sp. NPDC060011]|uniref:ATP synthase F0 subunit B n=1 Tax=Streptomyces sp. NPDC060011 TaxID=3347037 RepID=UPI0036B70D87
MAERSLGEVEDSAELAAYREALHDFADELNRLHIRYGAPSYRDIVKASVRPKLTNAGINEALTGRRLPSQEALLEFVRVVSSPADTAPGGPGARTRSVLTAHWRSRWQDVKLLHRQAQTPLRHLRATVKDLIDTARREAEATRTAAHEEAARVLDAAHAEAEHLRRQAALDAEEQRRQAREDSALAGSGVGRAAGSAGERGVEDRSSRQTMRRGRSRWWSSAAAASALVLSCAAGYALAGGFGTHRGSCASAPGGTVPAAGEGRGAVGGRHPGGAVMRVDFGPAPQLTFPGPGRPEGFPTTASPTPTLSPPSSAPPTSTSGSPSRSPTPHPTTTGRTTSGCG